LPKITIRLKNSNVSGDRTRLCEVADSGPGVVFGVLVKSASRRLVRSCRGERFLMTIQNPGSDERFLWREFGGSSEDGSKSDASG
jgi:hypothetical protein